MPSHRVAAITLALLLAACSGDADGGGQNLAPGGEGGGSVGAGGAGGEGGAGGAGGAGGIGGGGGEQKVCDADPNGEDCKTCLEEGIVSCSTGPCSGEATDAMICGAQNGCVTVENPTPDPACLATNCPDEAAALVACFSTCEDLLACGTLPEF